MNIFAQPLKIFRCYHGWKTKRQIFCVDCVAQHALGQENRPVFGQKRRCGVYLSHVKSKSSVSSENLKSPHNSGRCDTSGSAVALFVPEIWPEIQIKTQESRNTEIQKSKKSISSENLKSPKKSGRFDTSGCPVARFVFEIWPSRFFVPKKHFWPRKHPLCPFLGQK